MFKKSPYKIKKTDPYDTAQRGERGLEPGGALVNGDISGRWLHRGPGAGWSVSPALTSDAAVVLRHSS